MSQPTEGHLRLIEVHGAHGEELGLTRTFQTAREIQSDLLQNIEFSSLLFIGPGHGDEADTIFSYLRRDPSSTRIAACDLNINRIARFRERFPHAQVYIGDILSSGFKEFMDGFGPVDVIQMSFVLHDQTEQNKVDLLATIYRALSKGGVVVAADPTLPKYPNYLPAIPDESALSQVKDGLKRYFFTYIDEVKSWIDINPSRKAELIESLEKGLVDALKHEDGREAFDTPLLYRDRFHAAGFTEIEIKQGFNTVYIVRARKPG